MICYEINKILYLLQVQKKRGSYRFFSDDFMCFMCWSFIKGGVIEISIFKCGISGSRDIVDGEGEREGEVVDEEWLRQYVVRFMDHLKEFCRRIEAK